MSYYQFQGQLQGDSIFGLDDDEARRRRRHAAPSWEPYHTQGTRHGIGYAPQVPSSAPTAGSWSGRSSR